MSARRPGDDRAHAARVRAGGGDPVLDAAEVDRLEAKLAIDPGDEAAFPLLAEAYRQDGRADEARRVAEAGVLARPDSTRGRIALALALLDQGDAGAAPRAAETPKRASRARRALVLHTRSTSFLPAFSALRQGSAQQDAGRVALGPLRACRTGSSCHSRRAPVTRDRHV